MHGRLSFLSLLVCLASLACVVGDYDGRGSGCDDAHPCPAHLACVGGICGGTLSPPTDDGGLCATTADCANGLVCTGGSCTGCGKTACPLGEKCSNEACVPDCSVSLASLLAQSGDTVVLPACLYRDTLTLTRAVHVVGRAGAEIRGSDVFTTFTQDGGIWYSTATVPQFSSDTCEGDAGACGMREQVFLDGSPLSEVTSLPPRAGQFALDGNRHVYLATNPSGRTVEVSTRPRFIIVNANGVHLSNLVFRHAASGVTTGALTNFPSASFTVDHCTVANAAGACVVLRGYPGLRADHLLVGPCGADGIRLFNVDGGTLEDNVVHDANTAPISSGYDAVPSSVELTGLNLIATGNEVSHGGAYGLYVSSPGGKADVEDNRVHEVVGNGIELERAASATVAGNRVWDTGFGSVAAQAWGLGAGILIHDSHDVEVDHNIVAWCADGISVVSQADTAPWNVVYGINVHDNVVAMGSQAAADGWRVDLGFLSDQPASTLWSSPIPNVGHDNQFWNATPEGEKRFGWGDNSGIIHLSDFVATPGGTNSVYLTQEQLLQILTDAGVPAASSTTP